MNREPGHHVHEAINAAEPMFRITWGWGQRREFLTEAQMAAWIEANEDELGGMFGVKRYVRGADERWYPLGED